MPLKYFLAFAALTCDWALHASHADAQDFPTKPIRIFTSDPGAGNDLSSRLFAQGITGALGQVAHCGANGWAIAGMYGAAVATGAQGEYGAQGGAQVAASGAA